MHTQTRKVKKSFSISPESEAFLKRVRRERRVSSESKTLDLLLHELMSARKQRAIESAYKDYYDSVSDGDLAEQQTWGAFAESQLRDGAPGR
jgi:hypothetical protein